MIIPESFALEWTLNLWCFHWSYGRQHRIFWWKSKHGSYKIQKYITYILPKHLIKQNLVPFFFKNIPYHFWMTFFYDLTCQQLPTGEDRKSLSSFPFFPTSKGVPFPSLHGLRLQKTSDSSKPSALASEKPVGRWNFHQFKGCYCSEYMYIIYIYIFIYYLTECFFQDISQVVQDFFQQ